MWISRSQDGGRPICCVEVVAQWAEFMVAWVESANLLPSGSALRSAIIQPSPAICVYCVARFMRNRYSFDSFKPRSGPVSFLPNPLALFPTLGSVCLPAAFAQCCTHKKLDNSLACVFSKRSFLVLLHPTGEHTVGRKFMCCWGCCLFGTRWLRHLHILRVVSIWTTKLWVWPRFTDAAGCFWTWLLLLIVYLGTTRVFWIVLIGVEFFFRLIKVTRNSTYIPQHSEKASLETCPINLNVKATYIDYNHLLSMNSDIMPFKRIYQLGRKKFVETILSLNLRHNHTGIVFES